MENQEEFTRPPAASVDLSDPYAREAQIFPKFSGEQIAAVKRFGTVEQHPSGSILFARGDRAVDFFVVLKGCIEIVAPAKYTASMVITTHYENQFTGELDLFNNQKILVDGRMGADGEVIRVKRSDFRKLLAAETDIGEIITRAFILRRSGFIAHSQAGVMLLAPARSGDSLRIQRFLRRNGFPVKLVSDDDEEGRAILECKSLKIEDGPFVLYASETLLQNPTNREVAEMLGFAEEIEADVTFDVTIVGGGPAGLAAAVYAASEGLETCVIESESPGGQAGTSSKIENYLGFPTGISGQELAGRARIQAQKFGARISVPRTARRIDCSVFPYRIELEDDDMPIRTRSVVIATGARYRQLNVENLESFEGNGVHYAATAVEAAVCRNEEVIVVGGGNSAGQAAIFLSHTASHVHILVRSKELASSMSDYLISRIDASDRITLHTETEIVELSGSGYLESVRWRNAATGIEESRPISSVFLMLGASPKTGWIKDCVALDANGFIICGGEFTGVQGVGRRAFPLETSQPNVFAVGDVRSGSVKRVASAVGEGSVVVSSVHEALKADPAIALRANDHSA